MRHGDTPFGDGDGWLGGSRGATIAAMEEPREPDAPVSFDDPVDETPPSDDDPDVRALRRRDRAFVFRVLLRGTVALLLGVWIFLQLTSTDVGACAARGFGTVTE
jgi:hypothetical protein